MATKILIVEDHDDFRKIIRTHLESQKLDIQIFEAISGELGISKALRERPEIILMDIRLPGINGIDAAGRIKQHLPDCAVIVLTMFETQAFKETFKSKDVLAYIGKSELYGKLIPLIKKVIQKNGS